MLARRSCAAQLGPLSLSVPQYPWCICLSIKGLAQSLARGSAHYMWPVIRILSALGNTKASG